MEMTGVKCPTCAADGKEVWVIPGKACGACGTACWKLIMGKDILTVQKGSLCQQVTGKVRSSIFGIY
jgi:hypothetical protein